jgi:phage baseplate assembly protein gpV
VQVTLKLSPGVTVKPAMVKEAIDAASDHLGMKIVDFNLKGEFIHLAADVKNKKALSRGVQGFSIRLARAVNRAGSHTGKVFADRYSLSSD